MKKRFVFSALLLAFFLVGCNSNIEENQVASVMPDILEVVLTVSPENSKTGELVKIEALVTQGDENVEDANEVMFELWKDGEEKHEMLDGTHQGNGIYSIETSFDENGRYFVISHVTARDQHNMPRKEFIVGDLSTSTVDEGTVEEQIAPSDHASFGDGSHHSKGNVVITFHSSEAILEKETSLSTEVLVNDEPIQNANVKFEINKVNDSKHEFIDATEDTNGNYKAPYLFQSSGSYKIVIHVQNEHIHEHVEHIIEVK